MNKTPGKVLHRVALGSKPWMPYAGTQFRERFDDPDKQYLVLYAGSNRVGCFVECLAYFREGPKPGIEEYSRFEDDSRLPPGKVPPSWCSTRFSQSARIEGEFADVANSAWIKHFLDRLPGYLCRGIEYPWVDQSTIYQATFRPITQWISRTVFEHLKLYAGIYYTSKHGSDFSTWAVFHERTNIEEVRSPEAVSESDPDLLRACNLLGLQPPSGDYERMTARN